VLEPHNSFPPNPEKTLDTSESTVSLSNLVGSIALSAGSGSTVLDLASQPVIFSDREALARWMSSISRAQRLVTDPSKKS
jgi:hypothetical protein